MNRFEHAVHTTRRDEGELSSEKFQELWLETQLALFGDSVDTDGYGTWWSYIPHFIGTPGYVYAYSYGFLFALSIFRSTSSRARRDGEPHLTSLRAGGPKTPEELAEMVGRPDGPGHLGRWHRRAAVEFDEAEALAVDIGPS
jgi:oligoendopeptidase F